jgi:hypothetical protein
MEISIGPGQVWLVEQAPATALGALDRDAVTHADLVLYDRALARLVVEALPPGAYAEALPDGARAVSPRVLQFAADGWSVVQLVEACPGRRAGLMPAGNGKVAVIAKNGGAALRESDGGGGRLGEILAGFADEPVTVIFGPLSNGWAARRHAFAANGLAG